MSTRQKTASISMISIVLGVLATSFAIGKIDLSALRDPVSKTEFEKLSKDFYDVKFEINTRLIRIETILIRLEKTAK